MIYLYSYSFFIGKSNEHLNSFYFILHILTDKDIDAIYLSQRPKMTGEKSFMVKHRLLFT
jgi:hypothetical protein